MATRWSFNINGMNVPNWQQLLTWGKQNRPTWVLIMDSIAKCRQWKDEVGGEVICRWWDELDNFYHTAIPAKEASQRCATEIGDNKDFWAYFRSNEAGGNWDAIQDWIIDFATYNKQKGIKTTSQGLAIMKNWSSPAWVKAGHADKLIRYAHENRDTFILDIHEYVTGFAWSSHTPDYPMNLFVHELSTWGEHNTRIEWDNYADNWFLGRIGWVANVRAKELVGEVLPFVITEALFDWHSAVHNQQIRFPDGRQVEVASELRFRYGDDRYNRDIRGVLGQRRLFEWLATGHTNSPLSDEAFADVIMRNFIWTEKNYPDNCKGMMLFTMNPDWRFPEGHDFIPIANALLPKWNALTLQLPTPEPQEQPAMRPITVTGYHDSTQTSNKVNVRQERSTASPIVGILPAYPAVTSGFVAESAPVYSNNIWWQSYELELATGKVSGYMAQEYVKEVTVTELPPVEPPPATPKFYDLSWEGMPTIRFTENEHDKVVKALRWFADLLDSTTGVV
jgi:hypothetical protein